LRAVRVWRRSNLCTGVRCRCLTKYCMLISRKLDCFVGRRAALLAMTVIYGLNSVTGNHQVMNVPIPLENMPAVFEIQNTTIDVLNIAIGKVNVDV